MRVKGIVHPKTLLCHFKPVWFFSVEHKIRYIEKRIDKIIDISQNIFCVQLTKKVIQVFNGMMVFELSLDVFKILTMQAKSHKNEEKSKLQTLKPHQECINVRKSLSSTISVGSKHLWLFETWIVSVYFGNLSLMSLGFFFVYTLPWQWSTLFHQSWEKSYWNVSWLWKHDNLYFF